MNLVKNQKVIHLCFIEKKKKVKKEDIIKTCKFIYALTCTYNLLI